MVVAVLLVPSNDEHLHNYMYYQTSYYSTKFLVLIKNLLLLELHLVLASIISGSCTNITLHLTPIKTKLQN
jgi:hypothetical protein